MAIKTVSISSERMLTHFSVVLANACKKTGGVMTIGALVKETMSYYEKKGDINSARVANTLAYFLGTEKCEWIARQRVGITHRDYVVTDEQIKIDSNLRKRAVYLDKIAKIDADNAKLAAGGVVADSDDEPRSEREPASQPAPVAAPARPRKVSSK